MDLYYNLTRQCRVNEDNCVISGRPVLYLGARPELVLHFYTGEPGSDPVSADLSNVAAWRAAVDADWSSTTDPMCRTLPEDIDAASAASGVIKLPLNTCTVRFAEALGNRQSLEACFELRGFDASGAAATVILFNVICHNAVDADGGAALDDVPSDVPTKSWILAVLSGYTAATESINDLTIRVGSAETAISGATANIAALGTAIVGATASIAGLTARMDDAESAISVLLVSVAGKVSQMVYITDSETTNATLNFGGGTHLEFTQPLQGLTFASVEASHDESEIIFTAGTAFPADDPRLPVNASVIGEISIEAGKKYVLNLRDAAFVCGEMTVIGADFSKGIWFWDNAGNIDTTEFHGQTYLAGATIMGGTFLVNAESTVDAILVDDSTAMVKVLVGGTVGSVEFPSTNVAQSIEVSDGYAGVIGNGGFYYFSATITGGTVGALLGGSSPGTITVSDGLVVSMAPFGEGNGGSATITGGTVASFTASGSGTLTITGGYVGSISGGNNDLNVDISGGIIGSIDRDSIGGGTITITGGTILDEVGA